MGSGEADLQGRLVGIGSGIDGQRDQAREIDDRRSADTAARMIVVRGLGEAGQIDPVADSRDRTARGLPCAAPRRQRLAGGIGERPNPRGGMFIGEEEAGERAAASDADIDGVRLRVEEDRIVRA
jgi:hypothetical protein